MEIISRKEAKEKGLKKFFTGRACNRGHIGERRTSNGMCIKCEYINNKKFDHQHYKNNPVKPKLTNGYGPFLTRKLASKKGLSYYYDGIYCPNGHLSIKSFSNGCIECIKIKSREKWLKDHPKKQGPKMLNFGPFLTLKQAQEKDLDFYYVEPCFQCGSVIGYKTYKEGKQGGNKCLVCAKRKSKEWQSSNLEKFRIYNRRNSKKEKFIESRKKWYEKNRKKMNEWARNYANSQTANNTNYAKARRIRNRINDGLKNQYKNSSSLEMLGIKSFDEMFFWIESQFEKGMTWDNWSHNGWHLDHVRPLATFDLSDFEQRKTAFNWRNYQPLWGKENMSKQNNYTSNDELAWVKRMRALGYKGELFLQFIVED